MKVKWHLTGSEIHAVADCELLQYSTCYRTVRKDTHRKPLVPILRVAEGEACNRVYCYSLIWDDIVL